MALSRTTGLCRLALRTQWACAHLLSSVAAGDEPAGDEDKPGRRVDLTALRRERALRPLAERTQPAPPRKASRTLKSSYEQVQLNKAIRDSTSVESVLEIAAARPALLDRVGASSALSKIAKLFGSREPALWLKEDERFKQLLKAACSLMEREVMDAQGFSNMLYACGQLGIAPPSSWLRVYWDNSALVLVEFKPQELSNTLYACAQLDITPPSEWLQRYWHASASKLGDFIPQTMSNTLYACGQLCLTPPAAWLKRYWDANTLMLGEFIPQDFSNTMYACGQLGVVPPADWLQRFWHASASKLGEYVTQNFSNTLYACGQLGITPPADWLPHFWHASALKLGKFNPQELSNTLYACGQLGITPPDSWLQQFWHASAQKLREFVPQALSNSLLACAQLGNMPPGDWLQLLSDSYGRSLPVTKGHDLSNSVLSLAILGLWELPVFPALWERLIHALPHDTSDWNAESQVQAQQLYQAYQAAAAERPGLLPEPSPELLAAARKSWVDGLDDTSSKLHGQVSACLTRMGVTHANEHWCEHAERRIDIIIEGASPVALEVDGPHHFLQDGRQDGSTLLRNRMLAAHGWRVVVVDYRKWNALQTEAQREEFLRFVLAENR